MVSNRSDDLGRSVMTEFPIKSLSQEGFVNVVSDWLDSVSHSEVTKHRDFDKNSDELCILEKNNGEMFKLQAYKPEDDLVAVGFLSNIPDKQNRVWGIEAVLRKDQSEEQQDIFRLHAYCLNENKFPQPPRLIRLLFEHGQGGNDGIIEVSNKPIFLSHSEVDIEKARKVILGEATKHLPVLYISAIYDSEWDLTEEEIENLAFQLGGIAHIVVEPNRDFSFELGEKCARRNAYGGTVGFVLPGQGAIKKYYIDGEYIKSGSKLVNILKGASIERRRQLPFLGWDWGSLENQIFHRNHEIAKDDPKLDPDLEIVDKHTDPSTFANENILYSNSNKINYTGEDVKNLQEVHDEEIKYLRENYEEVIKNLREENSNLNEKLLQRPLPEDAESPEQIIRNLAGGDFEEIWRGEILDRLRFAIRETVQKDGVSQQTKLTLQSLLCNLKESRDLQNLRKNLRKASTASKNKSAKEFKKILETLGYNLSSSNKHYNFKPREGIKRLAGAGKIVIASTPSDRNAGKNARRDIEKILGLTESGFY